MNKIKIDRLRRKAIRKYRFVFKRNTYRIQEKHFIFWKNIVVSSSYVNLLEIMYDLRCRYFKDLCYEKFGTMRFDF